MILLYSEKKTYSCEKKEDVLYLLMEVKEEKQKDAVEKFLQTAVSGNSLRIREDIRIQLI